MKDLPTYLAEAKERFEDRFVFKDTGPDGDGYDANLPCWNDYFDSLTTDSEHNKNYDQIEAVQLFLEKELTQLHDTMREACRKIYVDGVDWAGWGMSDEEAGIEFDEAFNEVDLSASIAKGK